MENRNNNDGLNDNKNDQTENIYASIGENLNVTREKDAEKPKDIQIRFPPKITLPYEVPLLFQENNSTKTEHHDNLNDRVNDCTDVDV